MDRALPLNSIRVFSTVGRLLSFSQAARELNVTPSAVSHQIKTLEDYLGVELLRRNGSKVMLTVEGKNYLRQISEGMLTVSRATAALRTAKRRRIIRLSTPPSMSLTWLLPRLTRFISKNPDIPLAVNATTSFASFAAGDCDIALRYCQHPPPGMKSEPMCANEIFPVCSSKLMKGVHSLRQIANLKYHPMLDYQNEQALDPACAGWQDWLLAADIPDTTNENFLSFHPRYMVHEAVRSGVGVGLSKTLHCVDQLLSGELVIPFGPVIPATSNYYLVCPEFIAGEPHVATLWDFLIREARESRKQLDAKRLLTRVGGKAAQAVA